FAALAVASGGKKEDGNTTSSTSSTATTTAADPSKPIGACYDSKRGACTESWYAGIGGEASMKKVCDDTKGKWTGGGTCPATDLLIGSCTQMQLALSASETPKVNEKTFYYDEGSNKGTTHAVGKDGCDALSGKWTDGPAGGAK